MIKSIIKEIIIILLLLLAIILAFGVLFYDYIPANKIVPTVDPYKTSESITNELEAQITEGDPINIVYEITANDLQNLEKTNDYEKGKANPFANSIKMVTENELDVNGIGGGNQVGTGGNGLTGTQGNSTTNSSKPKGTK